MLNKVHLLDVSHIFLYVASQLLQLLVVVNVFRHTTSPTPSAAGPSLVDQQLKA